LRSCNVSLNFDSPGFDGLKGLHALGAIRSSSFF
jgi:hypothetical protein